MKNTKEWVEEILRDNPDFSPEEVRSASHNRLFLKDVVDIMTELNAEEGDNDEDKQERPEDENITSA